MNDLLSFSANRPTRCQSFLVKELLDEVLVAIAERLSSAGVEVEIDAPPEMVMFADREMLRLTLTNVMLNSRKTMPRGGDLVITAIEFAGSVEIELADSGMGLPERSRSKAALQDDIAVPIMPELDLTDAEATALAHGGAITSMCCPEGGTALTIRLPKRVARLAA